MTLGGKHPTKRRKIGVSSETIVSNEKSNCGDLLKCYTAHYIRELCAEMALMAKSANLKFLSHLLAMAEAEAEYQSSAVLEIEME